MPDTKVAYHVDDDGPRPAINVKVRASGWAFHSDAVDTALGEDAHVYAVAYALVRGSFWNDAEGKADALGLGPIAQRGRSGGWLVFTDGRDPQDCAEHPTYDDRPDLDTGDPCDWMVDWLAAYRTMTEWARTRIASVPAEAARLAEELAQDIVGEGSVTLRSWLAFGLFGPTHGSEA